MFKETPDGQTHYEGDNCGIKEHNMPPHISQIIAEFHEWSLPNKNRNYPSMFEIADWFALRLTSTYNHAISDAIGAVPEEKRGNPEFETNQDFGFNSARSFTLEKLEKLKINEK